MSSPHLLCLSVRIPTKTCFLYIGRGKEVEGVWVGESYIPSEYRVIDRFLEYLRKHLRGLRLVDLKVDENGERIVLLTCQDKLKDFSHFGLFWKGRDLYFAHNYINSKREWTLFCSWKGRAERIDEDINLIEVLSTLGRKEFTQNTSKNDSLKLPDDYLTYLEKTFDLKKERKKVLKKLERKRKNIEGDLIAVGKWHDLNSIATREIEFFSDISEVCVGKIKVKFKQGENNYQKRGKVFEKIKRLKSAENLLMNRMHQVENEMHDLLETKEILDISKIKISAPIWTVNNDGLKIQHSEHGYDIYFSSALKLNFAVGKNARANDYIRKYWAKGDDLWIHLENITGPHLIVKQINHEDMTEEIFRLLGSCLRDYAKIDLEEIPMVFSQVKHIKGMKGHAGSVLIRRPRYRKIIYNINWKNDLKIESK